MNISGYIKESIVDGEGVRAVIFFSGCSHGCPGCHSPQTHDRNSGEPFTLERQLKIIEEIKNNPLLSGVTLSGGDPFFSAYEVLKFVKLLRTEIPNINVWAYTGFTYEQLTRNKMNIANKLLCECNVLVDGKFDISKRDTTLRFKGSSNQRIIDVQKSLTENNLIIYMN
ncbi:Pyruvate formate-lyase 1-activating enzyme [compost metagenome]